MLKRKQNIISQFQVESLSFVYSVNEYLLNIRHVPDTVLGWRYSAREQNYG